MRSVGVPVSQDACLGLHDNTFQRACIVQDVVVPHEMRLLPGGFRLRGMKSLYQLDYC